VKERDRKFSERLDKVKNNEIILRQFIVRREREKNIILPESS
jgi:hypothetical protein